MCIAGDERGMTGVVSKVIRSQNKVIVEGLNKVYKHRRGQNGQAGTKTHVEAPIHVSNVAVVELPQAAAGAAADDQATSVRVRVGFKFLEDGTKVRVAKGKFGSGNVLERPGILKERKWARPAKDALQDTGTEAALKETYTPPQKSS